MAIKILVRRPPLRHQLPQEKPFLEPGAHLDNPDAPIKLAQLTCFFTSALLHFGHLTGSSSLTKTNFSKQ